MQCRRFRCVDPATAQHYPYCSPECADDVVARARRVREQARAVVARHQELVSRLGETLRDM
jgi:hypothetical protein